jgi:CubicO group peptidase (beta-lactamase class C family)
MMKQVRSEIRGGLGPRVALVLLPLFVAARVVGAQVAADEILPAALVDSLRAELLDTMERAGVPGVSITVGRDGRILWSEGLGWADLEQRVAVTPLTRFRVGSVSKSLTSAALGMLVEQGKVDLDQPVQRYVPSFPVKRWPITTRQLAGHIAGVRHYRGAEFALNRPFPTVADGLTIFADDSLLFEPGTAYRYSSYGYNLVSAVLEGASGTPFLEYMGTHVFRPAGMRQTVPDFVDSLIPFRARWYSGDQDGVVNAMFVDNSYKWAGGGFLSTTEDLVRFGFAMLDDKFVSRETRELLWTSLTLRDGKTTGYGLGWGVGQDGAGRRRVMHSGGSMGGTAYLVIYPEQRLVVALLANSDQPLVGVTPGIAARVAATAE